MTGRAGYLLDIGCKGGKQMQWLGIDSVPGPGVDVVHCLEVFPYPIEAESCLTIKAAQILEHFDPKSFFPFMNEAWRLLKRDGQIAISVPYAGSAKHWQDPTHRMAFTERSWQWLDPDFPGYQVYKPKPWKIVPGFPVWNVSGDIEVVLRKRRELTNLSPVVDEAIKIGAIQKPSEMEAFLEILQAYTLDRVVEIGTAKGGTFYALCKMATEDATIVSIDMPDGPFGGGYKEEDKERLLSYRRDRQYVHLLTKDSHLPETKEHLVQILGKGEIDLLLIDGDHTFAGVKQDYDMYSPLVKDGGLIAFHDICPHPNIPECQVDVFWRLVKKGKENLEIIDQADTSWGGIGILFKEKEGQ